MLASNEPNSILASVVAHYSMSQSTNPEPSMQQPNVHFTQPSEPSLKVSASQPALSQPSQSAPSALSNEPTLAHGAPVQKVPVPPAPSASPFPIDLNLSTFTASQSQSSFCDLDTNSLLMLSMLPSELLLSNPAQYQLGQSVFDQPPLPVVPQSTTLSLMPSAVVASQPAKLPARKQTPVARPDTAKPIPAAVPVSNVTGVCVAPVSQTVIQTGANGIPVMKTNILPPPSIPTIPSSEPLVEKKKKIPLNPRNGPQTPKVCANCGRTQTPIWRKNTVGPGVLCNACGIHLKQQGRMRPLDTKPRGYAKQAANAEQAAKKLKAMEKSQMDAQSVAGRRRKGIPDIFPRVKKSRPIRLNSLPLSKTPNDCADAEEMNERARGPSSLIYMGEKYLIGEYIAVNGKQHPEYYGVITGFDKREDGQKYFWMKWLVPKQPSRLGGLNFNERLTAQLFDEVQPEVITCEPMDAIRYVFDYMPPCSPVKSLIARCVRPVEEEIPPLPTPTSRMSPAETKPAYRIFDESDLKPADNAQQKAASPQKSPTPALKTTATTDTSSQMMKEDDFDFTSLLDLDP